MIIVIDNYDSFTYNLVHYIGEHEKNIRVIRNDEMNVSDILSLKPSKIVISPGPCTPKEAGVSVELIKLSTVPILGVCLGHQSIGAAFGGNIVVKNATEDVLSFIHTLKNDNTVLLMMSSGSFDGIDYEVLGAELSD